MPEDKQRANETTVILGNHAHSSCLAMKTVYTFLSNYKPIIFPRLNMDTQARVKLRFTILWGEWIVSVWSKTLWDNTYSAWRRRRWTERSPRSRRSPLGARPKRSSRPR